MKQSLSCFEFPTRTTMLCGSVQVPPLERVAHSPVVRVWAGASYQGRTKLHFYTGTLNGIKYRRSLKTALPEMKSIFTRPPWTFQHDGASPHSAEATNQWLQRNVPDFISSGSAGEWPANSPDINWMENVWSVLSDKIDEPRNPTTVTGLKRKLVRIWSALPDSLFENCVRDMPKRLQQVIDTQGKPLKK